MDDPVVASIALLLGLLVAAAGLALLARRLRIPDPVLLVLGGLALALVPNLPRVELEPELVFLLFLPPILYAAAYFTSIRDFRANLRPILLLSIGLVLFSTVVVGLAVSWLVPAVLGRPIELVAALALGAIVAPPDAVAATAIFQRLGVPERVVTILEGESLVNDATALVALNTTIAAWAAGGAFSLTGAAVDFAVVAVGGIAIGLLAGLVVSRIVGPIEDPVLGIVLTLLVPPLVFLPAELLHVSGVLAVVVAGLIAGRRAARDLTSAQRVQGVAAWSTALFVINGLVFILIGLQLPVVLEGLSDHSPLELVVLGVGASLAAIVTRFVWVFPATYLPRWLSSRIRARDPYPQPRNVAIVAWAGMRGVVSLAAALALPAEFPDRELILFLTFSVILATLVVQGLSLPLLIGALGVTAEGHGAAEERTARLHAAEAAVEAIERLRGEWPDHLELIDQLRSQYDHRVRHIGPDDDDGPRDEAERELLEHRIIRREVIDAERAAVVLLRDRGVIGDEALRRIERDLDLEELRLEA